MRVRIHRGANEIGGSCVEIESEEKRLVLDVGLPLSMDGTENTVSLVPQVDGFRNINEDLLAIIVSHPHQDHYGLIEFLRPDIPIMIGGAAKRMLKVASKFSPSGLNLENTIKMEDRKTATIGPFEITPFLVDHSAYDAYSILIEANGKRLFYSGDFRGHGRKLTLFEKFIASSPENIDVLLMEGSTIGRLAADETFMTEGDLEIEFAKLFQNTSGISFVFTSSQNIDRLVTIFRACLKSKRQLILDLYTAEILRATGNDRLPQGTWDNIRVFLPNSQRYRVIKEKLFDEVSLYKNKRIYSKQLAIEVGQSVMVFRPSMCSELEKANCLQGSRMIYSLWDGYLKEERMQQFLDWLKKHVIPMDQIHTSGHASIADLKRFASAINAKKLIPIHSFNPQDYSDLFDHVEIRQDGEWWEIQIDNGGAKCLED
jgi:ribonuclease J